MIRFLAPLLFILLSFAAEAKTFRLSQEALQQLDQLKIGVSNQLSLSQVNSLVKKIAKKGSYDSIKVYVKGKELYLDLKELSSSQNIEVIGNQALTRQQIFNALGVKPEDSVNKYEIERNIPKLERLYNEVGLLKVDISVREMEKDDKVHFVVEINEGTSSILTEIVVLSSNPLLNRYIKARVNDMIGRILDDTVIQKIHDEINQTLLDNRALGARIDNISPVYNKDRTESKLTITLENTTIYEFLFYGNEHFSYANIINHLDIDKNYLSFIKNRKLLVKYIKNLYTSNGFYKIAVVLEEVHIKKLNKTILKFTIKEGPQIKIKSISVVGKISRPSRYYNSLIRDHLGNSKNSRLYIKDNLEKAVDNLISHLKNEGYLSAEKISSDYELNNKNSVDIVVQINEGLLTQIRSIRFKGLKNFTSNQLYDVIDLQPNTPLNLNKVFDSYSALNSFYHKNGYLDFKVITPKKELIRYLENYEFADLNYELHVGPQVKIKDIITRGNKKTKSKVILRELDLEPGDILTSETINDSIVYLERTQLFSRAQINTSDVNTETAERTVYIDVQEKNPGLFSIGVGISNENNALNYRGYLGLSYKNLGGTGRGLSGRADANYSEAFEYLENRIVLGYYEPYLYFNRLRLRTSLLHEEDVFDLRAIAASTSKEIRVQENNEFNLSLEKQFTRELKLTWKLFNLSVLKTFNKDNLSDRTSLHIATVGPTLELDNRDDFFSPRDGSYSIAQVDYSAPFLGSTNDISNYIHFIKATAAHTIYTPLTENKRWVWVNMFSGGYLKNLSNLRRSGVPPTEAFFLGTRATIRGYRITQSKVERIPTLGEICNNCLLEKFRVKDDSQFVLFKSELRFPLYENIAGLVFYDGGAVYIDGAAEVLDTGGVQFHNVNIEDHYRDSAGFGFRYETPIGAFTAEIGFKLDRKGKIPGVRDAEDPFNFHISMSTF